MKRFQVLEHTADLKMRVFGNTLKELFQNAAFALAVNQKGNSEFKGECLIKKIKIKAKDQNFLLIDFLNQLLFLSDTEEKVFGEVKIKRLDEKNLEGEAYGYKYRELNLEIKAATYHEIEIKKEKGTFVAEIIFDI